MGSTQFREGRYNIAGTVIAVYVLAAGVKGLQLAGALVWIPDLFKGLAIMIAIGLANYEGTSAERLPCVAPCGAGPPSARSASTEDEAGFGALAPTFRLDLRART